MRSASTRVILASAGLLLVVPLAACSTSAAGSAPSATPVAQVTIVSGQQAQNGDLLKSLFSDYNAGKSSVGAPKTQVDLQLSNDSDVDTAQKVLLDLSSGHGPDAVRVTNATYRTLIDSGAAQPATTCLAQATDLNKGLLDGITVGGTVYQMPWYVTPNALFYNADLFRAAGLDPDKPPTTLEQVAADAKAIAALPQKPAGAVTYFGNDYNFQGYLASLGASAYNPDTKKIGIDSAAGRSVFSSYASMVADGSSPVYSNFFAEANDAFAGGRLGMMVTSASGYPALAKSGAFDLRIAPAPHPAAGKALAVTSTNGFVITTKDPSRQAAVCDALLSLVSPDAVTRTVTATATIPLNTATIDDAKYLADVYKQHPDWAAVRDQQVVPWVSLPDGKNAEYTTDYINAQTKVLNGSQSPDDAAKTLGSQANALLKG
ncbi:extracellular solute-binding protein [Plantibacter sp. Mn2098]|uniref:extracellular solute-binding protein n=1 Tax=Plantibacter sp. Mn2098 TaxID=3395266 RepID=UPI003BE2151C